MLKDLSRQRQVDVLCTTHNPVLLDELGNKMIPFISYVTRDENGDSHVNLILWNLYFIETRSKIGVYLVGEVDT